MCALEKLKVGTSRHPSDLVHGITKQISQMTLDPLMPQLGTKDMLILVQEQGI